MKHKTKLIFYCGKMGAGKSTHAKQWARDHNGICLSEDQWLATLYPDEIKTFDDYRKYAPRLKPLIEPLVHKMLTAGVSVVMDFPGNTVKQRAWFKALIDAAEVAHELIYLKLDDASCLQRLSQRQHTAPERASFDTEAVFYQVTRYFQEPSADEGFEIKVIT